MPRWNVGGTLVSFLITVLVGTALAQEPGKRKGASVPDRASKGSSGSQATRSVKVKYGSIVEAEFTEAGQLHEYKVETAPGDRLNLIVRPVGETLSTSLGLFDPSDNIIAIDPPKRFQGGMDKTKIGGGGLSRRSFLTSADVGAMAKTPAIETPALSARGGHTILVTNGSRGGVGVYQLYVGATLRDGTEIEPGGGAEEATPAKKGASGTGAPAAFSGRGFPGLPPVDFADAIAIDLPNDGVARGGINSTRDNVVRAFKTAPKGKSAYDVTLTRTKGTFPLGLVVLSNSNAILAQATLMAGSQVTTRLTFPGGPITIGVYRLDFGKDPGTGPTEFEVNQGRALNPADHRLDPRSQETTKGSSGRLEDLLPLVGDPSIGPHVGSLERHVDVGPRVEEEGHFDEFSTGRGPIQIEFGGRARVEGREGERPFSGRPTFSPQRSSQIASGMPSGSRTPGGKRSTIRRW